MGPYSEIDFQIEKYNWKIQTLIEYIAVNHGYTCIQCSYNDDGYCTKHILTDTLSKTKIEEPEYNFCSYFKQK